MDKVSYSRLFRHDQLPLSSPNVANVAPGVATSVSPCETKKNPLLPAMSPMSEQLVTNGNIYARAETPTAATATTASGVNKNNNYPDNDHE